MEKNSNMDKGCGDNNGSSLTDASRIRPIINVKSIITIIKHPLITLKIICAGIFIIILFIITLASIIIDDMESLKKLKGKKNEN